MAALLEANQQQGDIMNTQTDIDTLDEELEAAIQADPFGDTVIFHEMHRTLIGMVRTGNTGNGRVYPRTH